MDQNKWREEWIKTFANRPYRPSNGTEGYGFVENHCSHCIHEKFYHTQNHDDKQCEVLNKTLVEDDFSEWFYDDKGEPYCRCFKHWDWGFDDDGNSTNDPPPPEPYNPNQLVMPFLIEEIAPEINHSLINS